MIEASLFGKLFCFLAAIAVG